MSTFVALNRPPQLAAGGYSGECTGAAGTIRCQRGVFSIVQAAGRGAQGILPCVRKSACLLWRLIASRAATLVPTIAAGFHDDIRMMSATKSSMSLTTTAYCLGDFMLPYVVIPPGSPDHSMLTPIEPRAGSGYRIKRHTATNSTGVQDASRQNNAYASICARLVFNGVFFLQCTKLV
jgi:hypothetical protein